MAGARLILLGVLVASAEARALSDIWGTQRPASIEECAARVRHEPSIRSWYCYWRLAFEQRSQVPQVLRAMEMARRRAPGDPHPTFLVALMLSFSGDERTMPTYLEAQEGFRRTGDLEAEFWTVMAILERSAWMADASTGDRAYQRGLELAKAMNDSLALGYAHQTAAGLALGLSDYGRAETLLRQARALVPPTALWWIRWRVVEGLGKLAAFTGRPRLALESYDQAAALAKDEPMFLAFTVHGRAEQAVRLASMGELPLIEAEQRLEDALVVARAAGMKVYLDRGELPTLMLRAALRGPTAESVRMVEAALAYGAPTDQTFLVTTAPRLLARFAAETDPSHPEAARAHADRAVTSAKDHGYAFLLPLAYLAQAHVDWASGDEERFDRHSGLALDAIDSLRWSQPEALLRARTSAEWAFAYELLAGWRIDLSRSPGSVAQAFAVIERLRGRSLLDALTHSGAVQTRIPEELAGRRATVLAELTEAQRQLLQRDTSLGSRKELLRKVERAEAALADVEETIARADPASAPVPVASIREVQEGLHQDEALLSFQLWRPDLSLKAPYTRGYSWLTAVTRQGAFTVRIPDATFVESGVTTLRALLLRRDGSEEAAAKRLGAELLDPAVERLGGGIRTLVIVPDGPLHALPLELLRLRGGEPLGERFALSTVPSASLWLRWRRSTAPSAGPALALADPIEDAPPGRDRDAARWLEALRLPSLPHARAEASGMVQALGPGGTLKLGPEASEHFLKTSDLRSWGVIHFATHAVADDTEPNRSALVLAAGDPAEDGLLQPREIAAMDLSGKVILLSACRTASGELLQGENALGLVRAFFHGGARAVVASPWPLVDEEARALIDELSDRLRRGQTLGRALSGAKEARRRAGDPAMAWAGLQLYGEGDLVLGAPEDRRGRIAVATAAAILVLLALFAAGRWASRTPRGT